MSDSNPLSLNRQLAQRAKIFCSNLGLAQSTLARLLKIDDSQMSRFLNGQANLSSEKTLKLVRLMSLTKRDLELKFGSPEKLTGRLMHLQQGGKPMKLSNDGWVAKEADSAADPNNWGDDISNTWKANGAPSDDDLIDTLRTVDNYHKQAREAIAQWFANYQKAKPNKSGSTESPRRITDNDDSRRSGPRNDLFS